jgi:CSLREA domain-containing protein/uncharacterized repeat protein (TIGR01451 family)
MRNRGYRARHVTHSSLALVLALAAGPAAAVNFVVNTTADTVDAVPGNGICADGAGQCSLRAAVMEANALPGADRIDVPPGNYALTREGGSEDGALTGDLDIRDDLLMVGAWPGTTTIDGIGRDRDLHVLNGANFQLTKVAVRNGNPGNDGGGIAVADGSASISDATIADNAATRGGGAAVTQGGGSLTLERVTVFNNRATTEGGGLLNLNNMTLINSTVSGNVTNGTGGAISNRGVLSMTNVTVARNRADNDGNNSATGGGLSNFDTATVRNSILADNFAGGALQNCFNIGNPIASHYSLEDNTECGFTNAGDRQSSNPQLGDLGDYGGPTPTQPILTGSAALNAADDSICPPIDQRGEARAGCDIGAYEAPPPADLWITVRDNPDPVGRPGDNLTYTVTVTNNGPGDAGNVSFNQDLADSASLLSVVPDRGSCTTPVNAVNCIFGALPAGAQVSAQVTVAPRAEGALSTTVTTAPGLEPDPNISNNSDTEDTTVNPPPSTGGGGGALSPWLLALALPWALRRRLQAKKQ